MATIKRELSTKINGNGRSEIIIRLSIGRGIQPRLKSGLFIAPDRFNDGRKDPKKAGAIVMPRANQREVGELREIESKLTSLEQYLLDLCTRTPKEQISKDFLTAAIDRHQHPERYQPEEAAPIDIYAALSLYLEKHPLAPARANHYKVLGRALKRFELYHATIGAARAVTLDAITPECLEAFEKFLRAEPELYYKFPEIYNAVPSDTRKVRKSRRPAPKGNNTICCTFKRFRAFFNWCNEQGLTDNNPFAKFRGIGSEMYGTPYYISIAERDAIADYDLAGTPALEVQRDIFVFHCLIGCRVSDLLRLKPANIIRGAVEYIASKTKEERPEVIRVPLHPRAAALVKKYAGVDAAGRLSPFISAQRYNDAIKAIFTRCGITRAVTVLDPVSGVEEQRPLNEIASSHIARRTFVGNLYKQVKDPNLVGKLSGHKEGSRAFTRYRDIDDEMKRDLINLL